MNEYKFDKEFITNLKKDVINYVSRTNININKITFNLSMYTNFVVNNNNDTTIKVTMPRIENKSIIPATIEIGKKYFKIENNEYYIKSEYEDLITINLTKILVKGASIKVKYDNVAPVGIEGVGLVFSNGNGYDDALTTLISEDINNYMMPDFEDIYSFNKGIVRMIMAITGPKYSLNSYFNHDKSLFMSMYSISVDSNLFVKINKQLTLIKYLIGTLNSKVANIDEIQKETIEKMIKAKETSLMNMVINKLYIPYINSVPLDKRKQVRDEILKGYLGMNYANLKLNDENRENYYWASMITNTVPINNKVSDHAWSVFREEVAKTDEQNMHDIYVLNAQHKSKNNIKEFLVVINNEKITIDTGKKIISEKNLVLEILSYAYISGIDDGLKEKLERGIVNLCNNNSVFTSALNSNPLGNRMLIAAIIQLADKNGFKIGVVNMKDNVATFKVKERVS
ncbi:MAG: hypothetical protein IJ565_00570 [Bacilli bacterium]|nr:hypothetical protein [Bacilli bacterium]